MNNLDFKKLNYYLNGCFKKLEENDSFLLRNIDTIARLSDETLNFMSDYQLENKQKENHLTFNDIYMIAREIVQKINPNYLPYYDNLIRSGQLDFDYDNISSDSFFHYNINNDVKIIDIKRKFNYEDVVSLIHEFMHYMNFKSQCLSKNGYLLAEAISIYFEIYARIYLLEKGINQDELSLDYRIISLKNHTIEFNHYNLILLAYEKFGEIDENTYKWLQQYYINISKESFLNECQNVLNKLEIEEKKHAVSYKKLTTDNKQIDYEDFLFDNLIKLCNTNYRYILGTYIAYYALENTPIDKMVYLCDHINVPPYSNMSLIDILLSVGIDINKLDVSLIKNEIEKNKNITK